MSLVIKAGIVNCKTVIGELARSEVAFRSRRSEETRP